MSVFESHDVAKRRCLRVLHIEDSQDDHELLGLRLRRDGLEVMLHRVESEQEFRQALDMPWDVVLSDYTLPGFSGLLALEILKDSGLLIPFVIVSGLIGEDTAVSAMRAGASDYLLKDKLARLAPAIERAIQNAEAQRARQLSEQALAESRQRLSELAQHLQTSVDNERAAIAREIHDDVGGALTALKFDLAWIARHSTDTQVLSRARQALELVDHALGASQRIMLNLRPAVLDQGLVPALQWMTQDFSERTGITAHLRTGERVAGFSADVAMVVYRVVQEALTNVRKHSGAAQVSIDLALTQEVLSVEVSDDGHGWLPQDLKKAGSFGLRGLRERAQTVGGWIDLSSSPRGATLIVSIPLQLATSGQELSGVCA